MAEHTSRHDNEYQRLSPSNSESQVARELRDANFGFLRGQVNYDGSLNLPSLDDWKDAENTALRRIARRAQQEQTAKTSPSELANTSPTSTDSPKRPS